MYGEIIAVGEEVLAGDVINSNAAVISNKLADIGVFCRFHSVVGDIEEDIHRQLAISATRSKLIILCGGLGPTKDDLTKEALASFLHRNLYEDPKIVEDIKVWFAGRNVAMSQNNFKQALMIDGGESLINANGTAPGVYIQENGIHYFLLPGPPNELIPMFEQCALPKIKPFVREMIISKTFKLVNIGESTAVTILDDIMEASEDFILAPYAKMREVHIKATAIGSDLALLENRIKSVEAIIEDRLGPYIYSKDGRDLNQVIIDLLKEKAKTVSTAESCTGGLIASSFVDKAGVSSVFMEGLVTYSNESKMRQLKVESDIIRTYGAVSEETAYAMVKGLLDLTGTDYGIAVTGIAGPDGGTEEKPVGLVYISLGLRSNQEEKDQIFVFEHRFMGSREKIRNQAAKSALIHLWDKLTS
jgi:nicotinamide-nucleotide amidase